MRLFSRCVSSFIFEGYSFSTLIDVSWLLDMIKTGQRHSLTRIAACVWGSINSVCNDDDPIRRAWQAMCWLNQRKRWNRKRDFPHGLLSTGNQTENVSLIFALHRLFTEILNWRLNCIDSPPTRSSLWTDNTVMFWPCLAPRGVLWSHPRLSLGMWELHA